jgi:hypothetical protein
MRKFFFLTLMAFPLYAQYLSNLQATQDDPVYTTYAAALNRSEYIVNQGYQFVWFDPAKGLNFEVKQAGNWGLAFKADGKVVTKLEQFYQKPVITASYSDLVKYYYYPFKNIKVETFFLVYSSRIAVRDIKVTNESSFDYEFSLFPYLSIIDKKFTEIKQSENINGISFQHKESPDSWMKEHNIPFQENLVNVFVIDSQPDSWGSYDGLSLGRDTSKTLLFNNLKSPSLNETLTDEANVIALQKNYNLKPGETVTVRVIRGIAEAEKDPADLISFTTNFMKEDLNKYLKEDEKLYSRIPELRFDNEEHESLYWNAFNLIRQCMLPPEGKSSYNYYVFSREPRWGWGYGGQVFHESLVMLAYAFMDPESAMNSQRVYIERQWDNGYINYRTGPYLDEQIVTNNEYTSSAPWYNWQNWEIYKITGDKKFLKEAYESGKKFYSYYVSSRDKDDDGLVEWGAHAVLESVRDARVAVWDEVADPVNFDAVDANSMLVSEAKALAGMAEELGLNDEMEKWTEDADNRTELINKYMWDNETGFYYQVDKKDNDFTYEKKNDLKRKEIIGFLPMWAGVASKEQAAELVKSLLNEDEFWRNFGIPSLSASDPYYSPIGYWNGPVWVQWQYLIIRGLIDYGYKEEAKQLMNKVLDNISNQLKRDHFFWEFYSADDYQAGWNKTYIWTGIIARMLIDLNK